MVVGGWEGGWVRACVDCKLLFGIIHQSIYLEYRNGRFNAPSKKQRNDRVGVYWKNRFRKLGATGQKGRRARGRLVNFVTGWQCKIQLENGSAYGFFDHNGKRIPHVRSRQHIRKRPPRNLSILLPHRTPLPSTRKFHSTCQRAWSRLPPLVWSRLPIPPPDLPPPPPSLPPTPNHRTPHHLS